VPFKHIFKEIEAFDYKCEVIIKIKRLFNDIFRKIEALITRLFEDISNATELFLK
jgi:hypothetical protein